jgi:hypothetical protein
MATASEDLVFDFIEENANAAIAGEPLFEAELHDTLYRPIKKRYGIRVGDGDSELSPTPGGEELAEFNGVVPIVIYSAVTGPDRSDRKDARAKMMDVAKAVAKLFLDDPTMGGRVTDSRVKSCPRGWDSYNDIPYSVANMVLLVNETGGTLP